MATMALGMWSVGYATADDAFDVDLSRCIFCNGLNEPDTSQSCRCPRCYGCDQPHREEDLLIFDNVLCCPSCATEAV